MYRKRKDSSLCCYEPASWMQWSCSNWFCVKSQPRLFHLGKAGALMQQTNNFMLHEFDNKGLPLSRCYDPMVTHEDVWLNAFAKSFLFKKGRRDWDEYTWNSRYMNHEGSLMSQQRVNSQYRLFTRLSSTQGIKNLLHLAKISSGIKNIYKEL